MSATPDTARTLTSFGSDAQALGAHARGHGVHLLARIVPYLKPYTGRFILMAVLTVVGSTMRISTILFIKPFTEIMIGKFDPAKYADVPGLGTPTGQHWLNRFADLLAANPSGALLVMIGLVVGVLTVQAILGVGATYLQGHVGGRVGMDVQRDLVDRVLEQPVGFFSERGKGELLAVINGDALMLYRSVYLFFDRFVRGGVEAAIALSIALALHWQLAAIAALVLGPTVVIMRGFGKHMKRRERATFHFRGVSGVILQEMVAAPRVIKAYLMERYFADRLTWARRKLFRRYMSLIKAKAWSEPTVVSLVAAAIAGFLYYNGMQVLSGQLAVEDLVLFYAALLALVAPIQKGAKGYSDFVVNLQSASRVFDLMDRTPALADDSDARELPRPQGRIAFDRVRFGYRPGQQALDGVSFTIEPGETVALVGPSGAGKSTVAALLLRLYDVQGGAIRIDGHDIAHVTQTSLRRHVGLVPQESIIFSDTVRANITCGQPATQEEVEAAARAAQAHDFILSLPRGYDTDLGDMGTDLSGGQRQRIAVARCLFRDTPILILDEATSSLDAVTEAEMQSAIELLTAGRTTIVIAHRFSTIQSADRIIFLDQGVVRGSGTHAELYAGNALYRELLARQALTVDGLQPAGTATPAG